MTSVTASQLTFGTTYTFVVQSGNSFGLSAYSAELPLICATTPAKPLAPTTENLNSNVVVRWQAPSARGLPILSYSVYFRKSDLTFDMTSACNGGDATIMAELKCTVPLLTLRSPTTFNLAQENIVVV